MKNLTPEHMRCAIGASCPSVHELPDGRLLIVGLEAEMIVPPEEINAGPHETAIVIDRALLADVLGK